MAAPSGRIIQPWRFIVVTKQETKEKVLLINGSPCAKGNTSIALAEVANNTAWLLKSTGGKPAPGRGDEPWKPMLFIR